MNPALLVAFVCFTEEAGLGTVNFLRRIMRKAIKGMQHVKVKDQNSITVFHSVAHHELLGCLGPHSFFGGCPLMVLHVFTVFYMFVIFYY